MNSGMQDIHTVLFSLNLTLLDSCPKHWLAGNSVMVIIAVPSLASGLSQRLPGVSGVLSTYHRLCF